MRIEGNNVAKCMHILIEMKKDIPSADGGDYFTYGSWGVTTLGKNKCQASWWCKSGPKTLGRRIFNPPQRDHSCTAKFVGL